MIFIIFTNNIFRLRGVGWTFESSFCLSFFLFFSSFFLFLYCFFILFCSLNFLFFFVFTEDFERVTSMEC